MKTGNVVPFFSVSFLVKLALPWLLYSCNGVETKKQKNPLPIVEEAKSKNSVTNIDLRTALAGYDPETAVNVTVKYDHFFKTAKKYKGYLLSRILDSFTKATLFDTSNAMVLFECGDGYRPVMELSKIFGNRKGYLAYRDEEQPNGKNWPDSLESKFPPYYLVWDDVPKDDQSFMWPYGLTEIKIISSVDPGFMAIYPGDNLIAQSGFKLFRDNCMKCHSINKIGGSMGPEFNIPKNITEYWKKEEIIAFAKAPSSYRYNSRMPPITTISDSDFESIISYLIYMKTHKAKQ